MSELLHRAVQILDVLRLSDDGLSIRQVADRSGLSKSTVQRLLRELVDTELAGQDPQTQRYRLGPRTLALGVAYQNRLNVRQTALAHMKKLRDATGETVGLSVGFGDQMMHIEQVESTSELRASFDIGQPLPLWSGAPSRLFLAERTDDEIRHILADRDHSEIMPIHPPNPEVMLEDIRSTRTAGYARAVEETLPGVSTLSVPIRGAVGELVATLSLTSPSSRFTQQAVDTLLPQLLDIARTISIELGWVPPRRGPRGGLPELLSKEQSETSRARSAGTTF